MWRQYNINLNYYYEEFMSDDAFGEPLEPINGKAFGTDRSVTKHIHRDIRCELQEDTVEQLNVTAKEGQYHISEFR